MPSPAPLHRYRTDLAPGVHELNDQLLQRPVPPNVQSSEQIEEIVKAARQAQQVSKPTWAE